MCRGKALRISFGSLRGDRLTLKVVELQSG